MLFERLIEVAFLSALPLLCALRELFQGSFFFFFFYAYRGMNDRFSNNMGWRWRPSLWTTSFCLARPQFLSLLSKRLSIFLCLSWPVTLFPLSLLPQRIESHLRHNFLSLFANLCVCSLYSNIQACEGLQRNGLCLEKWVGCWGEIHCLWGGIGNWVFFSFFF